MLRKRFTLTLVRHGETLYNRENRMQGQLDTQLSELGETQAKLVGQHLRDNQFTHMYSSDLSRAAETARAIIKANVKTTSSLVLDARLRERCFGCLEGQLLSEFQRIVKELNVPPHTYTPEGGETIEQVTQRAREFFLDLCNTMIKTGVPAYGGVSLNHIHRALDGSDTPSTSRENGHGRTTPPPAPPPSFASARSAGSLAALSVDCDESSYGSAGSNVIVDDDHVLVVSHGLWLREFRQVVLSFYKGDKLHGEMKKEASRISPNTGVSRLRVEVEKPDSGHKIHIRCTDIVFVNDTSHLQGADQVSHAKFQGAF